MIHESISYNSLIHGFSELFGHAARVVEVSGAHLGEDENKIQKGSIVQC
jgi:hypothetical protein